MNTIIQNDKTVALQLDFIQVSERHNVVKSFKAKQFNFYMNLFIYFTTVGVNCFVMLVKCLSRHDFIGLLPKRRSRSSSSRLVRLIAQKSIQSNDL